MKFASLGSGSEGNGLLIETRVEGRITRVLLDCGFTLKEALARLQRLNAEPESLNGILVTHEHSDHASGAFRLARHLNIPVYLSYGTYLSCHKIAQNCMIEICADAEKFTLGDLEISPFTVPHDAAEPLQFSLSDGARKLGVLTDLGTHTPHVVKALSGCHSLVLECNHDAHLLAQSAYPYSLKQRIGGDYGHLANHVSAQLLAQLVHPNLKHVIAAHLSQNNNAPNLVATELSVVLGCAPEEVEIACQTEGFAWHDV